MTKLVALSSLLVVLCGCSATIVPPPDSADSVLVVVPDYGRHSSVVFPDADGRGSVEYAFGDWNWFAGGRNSIPDGVQALLWSGRSTLGRRHVDESTEDAKLRRALGAATIIELRVPRDRALALRDRLGAKFDRQLNTAVYNQIMEMHFVPDAEEYRLWHNCNHVTARWLRKMGCEVRGDAMTSKFKVKRPSAAE